MRGKERNSDSQQDPFVDQAWSKMSELLDKEMPVATQATEDLTSKSTAPRFRYAYVLLFLLIGFVAGAGLMLVLTDQSIPESPVKSNPVEAAPAPKAPIAAKPNMLDEQSVLAGQYTPPRQSLEAGFGPSIQIQPPKIPDRPAQEEKARPPDRSSPAAVPLAAPSQSSKGNSELNTSYDINSTLLKTNTNSANKAPAVSTAIRPEKKEDVVLIEPLVPAVQESQSISYWSSIDRLPSAPALLEESPKIPSLLTQLSPKARKWELGLIFGSLSERLSEASGLTAGIYVKYQLDRRFGLRTGIAYTYLNKLQETRYTRSEYNAETPVVTGPNTLGD
ncbi:MAG: hypothetical protein AAFP19_14480, partial [Bacteroidota bacterium]